METIKDVLTEPSVVNALEEAAKSVHKFSDIIIIGIDSVDGRYHVHASCIESLDFVAYMSNALTSFVRDVYYDED